MKNNKLFCIYCICFAKNKSNDLCNINGLELQKKNGRIGEKICRHEKTSNHLVAFNKYNILRYGRKRQPPEHGSSLSAVDRNRYVVTRIIRIIVY